MASNTSSHRRSPVQTFTATIPLRGQEFSFKLSTRPLPLGRSATVQYYWMDSRQFRRIGSNASADNFRNCVGHWAASMHDFWLGDDLDQQTHFITAACYPLVTGRKSLQDIYRDAYLSPRVVQAAIPLPKRVHLHIQDIVAGRDRFRIQEELDQVLGRFDPPSRVLPLLQEAFRHWVGKGVVLLRQQGSEGLEQFLHEADYWLCKYRKRSGLWVRHFINLFAYECKVSFYRCYANAWVDLIPWLRRHRGLDTISERFLRFWHNQNQPIEVPHGQTLGGIAYPTHGRATVIQQGRGNQPVRRSIIWETPHVGPTHVRDVFSGQVLSLHPLSAFFMQDPQALAAAGRFFTSDDYDNLMVRQMPGAAPEYWKLVGAILTAAYRYRQALDDQAQKRRVRPSRSDALAMTACPPEELSDAAMLEDFVDEGKTRCPDCGGKLRFDRYSLTQCDCAQGLVYYRCKVCHRPVPVSFQRSELERFLLGAGD